MQVEIKNTYWNVVLTSNKKNLLVNNKVCGGATHYRDHMVYIDSGLKIREKIRVLIHELTHIVIYVTQVNPKDYYNEEDLCEFMGLYGGYVVSKAKDIIRGLKDAKDIK